MRQQELCIEEENVDLTALSHPKIDWQNVAGFYHRIGSHNALKRT
jgi:hypothetical protein